MWQDKLNEIIEMQSRFGRGREINSGAKEGEINALKEAAQKELNISLPEEYLNVLRTVNGLEFNGYILYGIDTELLENTPKQSINGLIDLNKVWYENEWQKQYIFLGEGSLSWYVYVIDEKAYYELDSPSGDIIEKYDSFEAMLEQILETALM